MHTSIAGLDVEIFQARPQAPRGAVLLCHGYGASGDDLVALGGELVRLAPALADVRFYFPAAPLSLGNTGWGDPRAWWPIDVLAIQHLQRSGEDALASFRTVEPAGMALARKALLAVVNDIATHTQLPMHRLALGGFSQGAMLATDVALRLEEAPGGLCILSGTLLTESVWKTKATARAGLPVFQSHGREDAVLPFHAAQRLHAMFLESGLQAEFLPFFGGHTIPPEALARMAAFLAECLE
jgi:phospholipase/carboxylesterase